MDILNKLRGVKKLGSGEWMACCPAHEDKTPSLHITQKGDKTLYHCHAGCDQSSVLKSLGLLSDDPLFKSKYDKVETREFSGGGTKKNSWPEGKPDHIFPYFDENDQLIFERLRWDNPKDFRSRRPDPDYPEKTDKKYLYNLKGIELPLYNLQGIIKSNQVLIVEGEKDVETCSKLGFCATCSPYGSKWDARFNQYLKNKDIIIIPDNDTPGRKYANQIQESLFNSNIQSKIIDLGVGEKQDITDWVENGGTGADLFALIAAASYNSLEPVDSEEAETLPLQLQWPDQKMNGTPLNTIRNLEHLLHVYQVKVKYNVISKRVEIIIPGASYSVDNDLECCISEIISMAGRHRLPVGNITDFLTNIADKNQFNPVKSFVETVEWNGHDYISDLADTLKPKNKKLARIFLERWMVSAIAAAYEPNGVAAQGVLVLQGVQAAGKTGWLKSLVANEDLFKEAAILKVDDRDSVKQCVQHWIVELGELEATLKRSDQSLRAFLTLQRDEYRKPYGRGESRYPRRTVFCATVNEMQYLRDPEGNRRFWTIACEGYLEYHNVDVRQAWAQALSLYQTTKKWDLSREELAELNEYNEDFEGACPITERILAAFDLRAKKDNDMTATDVLIACGYERPTKGQTRDCSSILRKLLQEEPRRTQKGRVFKMPQPLTKCYI